MLENVFDSHTAVKGLLSKGFTESQAEEIVGLVKNTRDLEFRHLATKLDLANTENKLRQEIRGFESRLGQEIHGVESRLGQEINELRQEIHSVENRLGQEINELRQEIHSVESRLGQEIKSLEVKISETKSEVLKWFIGVTIAQVTIIVGILKFL